MKASVILCNYNYGRFIGDAIDSVIGQSHRDFELIIVDDGSTDESASVISQYVRRYPELVTAVYQENGGQAAAFNTGFLLCKGEVVSFLDSDDTWYPQKLEFVLREFENPNVVGVMHQYDHIDAGGKIVDSTPAPRYMPSGDLSAFVVRTGAVWCFAATSGLSYRRRILENVFPIDTQKWRLCADGALAFTTAFLGEISAMNCTLSSYRIHGRNQHANNGHSPEVLRKAQNGMEMTNGYVNEFLQTIGRVERVSLDRNLTYARSAYYLRGELDIVSAAKVATLIIESPLYDAREKIYFLARFIVKSILTARPLKSFPNRSGR